MEVFQPFGSEAWPSGQRHGFRQSQEVVVQNPGRSADREGAVIVAQRADLRGKGPSGPLRGQRLRETVVDRGGCRARPGPAQPSGGSSRRTD